MNSYWHYFYCAATNHKSNCEKFVAWDLLRKKIVQFQNMSHVIKFSPSNINGEQFKWNGGKNFDLSWSRWLGYVITDRNCSSKRVSSHITSQSHYKFDHVRKR